MRIKRKYLSGRVMIWVLFLIGFPVVVYAQESSTLKKFENSIKTEKSDSDSKHKNNKRNKNSDDSDSGFFSDLFTEVLFEMSFMTLERMGDKVEPDNQRKAGDMLIPFARYDYSWQAISNTVHANANRIEVGYGPFALQMEKYEFTETSPANTLTLIRQLFLYRLSPSAAVEFDIGAGSTLVSGSQTVSLDAVAFPVKVPLGRNFAVEFIPVWAESMKDYEFALHMGMGRYGALRVGYRSLRTPGMELSGSFAGFAAYF